MRHPTTRAMSRRPILLVPALACGILALGLPPASNAIEWAAEPAIGIGGEYNDNIFLTTAPHEAVHGLILTPTLGLSARQQNWELRSDTRLTDKRYAGRSDIDADNGIETLNYKFSTERSLFQLKSSYANEAAWASNQVDPDIGLVQTSTRRYTTSVGPTWTWSVTETVQLSADYQWSNVKYDEKNATSSLLDYQQQMPTLSISNQIGERTQLSASVAYSEFEVTTPESEVFTLQYTPKSRSTYAQIGLTQDITETLKGSLSAGPRNTKAQNASLPWILVGLTQAQFCSIVASCESIRNTSNSHGTVFSGTLESTLELTHTTLSASRVIDASGSGTQVETTSANLRIERQITPVRLSAWFSADGYLFKALNQATTPTDRHYYQLAPGLRWRWTEYLSLDASYRYQRQRYVGQNDYAKSNAVYVSLTYSWPKFSVSR